MFPKVERLSAEFSLLTLQEKADFLRTVTLSAGGKWEVKGVEISFTPPSDELWTLDAENAWFELLK